MLRKLAWPALHSVRSLIAALRLRVGCGGGSTTTVDAGLDGPKAQPDGGSRSTTDLARLLVRRCSLDGRGIRNGG